MKKTIIAFMATAGALLLLAVTSCKKDKPQQATDSDKTNNPVITAKVTIGNKEYSTVKIGTLTWTAENYAGTNGMATTTPNATAEYGKYYTLDEAKVIPLPVGWRLPTKADFNKLLASQNITLDQWEYSNDPGVRNLCGTQYWYSIKGTNTSGFNSVPAGHLELPSTLVQGQTHTSKYWTATTNGNKQVVFHMGLTDTYFTSFYDEWEPAAKYRLPLRFVKDN